MRIKKYIKKHKKLYKYIILFISFLESLPYRISFLLFSLFPIKTNKIVISSYYGKGFGDNSKYIVNELLQRKKDIDIVWLVKNIESEFPLGIRKIKFNSLKSFYEISTAKIWIDNCRKPYYITKRKNQTYIQTWHSSLRLKNIEKDVIEQLSANYIKNAKADSKMIDILTVGCKFSEDTFDRAFWYNGPKMRCGTPRCDLFFDEDSIDKLRKAFDEKYNLKGKKIILYAPTFKKSIGATDVSINFESFMKKISKSSKNEYVLFVKLHPISKNKIEDRENIINFTDYPDIQELIAVCDYFITDYSGCCFDAMIAQKPCILYTPDLEEYLKNERSLCFDFNELPFEKKFTEDELIESIIEFNYDDYIENINSFSKMIGTYEKGNASKLIVDYILQVIGE